MKKILITGKDSYIGTSLEKWLCRDVYNKDPSYGRKVNSHQTFERLTLQYKEALRASSESQQSKIVTGTTCIEGDDEMTSCELCKYEVETLDMRDGSWKEKDFSQYDVVFHVAGIAHVSTDPKMKDIYYKVNRDLAIETAEKAKKEGVKQFIFMSSIIVYGDSSLEKRVISRHTVPNPSNFYGDSKLQAEIGIKKLETDTFKIAVLRPPMIYGKGAKGNYLRLSKFARKMPVFPDINNERSMLHIDNLCEFIKVLIDTEKNGLFFPQNKEYVKTSKLVKTIAEIHGKRFRMTRAFNWIIKSIGFKMDIVNKVFGNLVYDKSMSDFYMANYQIRTFKESIELTER